MTAVASRSHRDTKTDEYLAAYRGQGFRQRRLVAEILPGRGGRSRHLSAPRPHHGMGHRRRPRRAARRRRHNDDARRQAVPVRQDRRQIRQPILRGPRPVSAISRTLRQGVRQHPCQAADDPHKSRGGCSPPNRYTPPPQFHELEPRRGPNSHSPTKPSLYSNLQFSRGRGYPCPHFLNPHRERGRPCRLTSLNSD